MDWADNWLSNGMAWAAHRLVHAWCNTPEHWTSKVSDGLFTDCPCCALFRGIVIGLLLEFAFLLTLILIVYGISLLWR